MESGIYQIINIVNGKSYVGSSKNMKNRFYTHKSMLRNRKHKNNHLQSAWNKYGEENFIFLIIQYCKNKNLEKYEQYWINNLNVLNRKKGYNIKPEATNNYMSKETREKISNKLKGRPSKNKGKKIAKMSEERKQKIRKAHLGQKLSKEHKEKIGLSSSKFITFNGITLNINGWAGKIGIDPTTLTKRLQRWSLEKALTTPRGKKYVRK